MTLLAHAGHWLPSLVFIVPVVAIGVLVLIGNRREKRRKRARTDENGAAP